MYTQMLVLFARNLLSSWSVKNGRGQGLSEYLGLLVGLGIIIAIVIAIIMARMIAKANSSSW